LRTRGGAAPVLAATAFGVSGSTGAASLGGLRELFLGGGCGFGVSRRVIRPCPVVHRFVVSQYSISPAGKLRTNGMNAIGRTSSITRCAGCMFWDMRYDDVNWLAA